MVCADTRSCVIAAWERNARGGIGLVIPVVQRLKLPMLGRPRLAVRFTKLKKRRQARARDPVQCEFHSPLQGIKHQCPMNHGASPITGGSKDTIGAGDDAGMFPRCT